MVTLTRAKDCKDCKEDARCVTRRGRWTGHYPPLMRSLGQRGFRKECGEDGVGACRSRAAAALALGRRDDLPRGLLLDRVRQHVRVDDLRWDLAAVLAAVVLARLNVVASEQTRRLVLVQLQAEALKVVDSIGARLEEAQRVAVVGGLPVARLVDAVVAVLAV